MPNFTLRPDARAMCAVGICPQPVRWRVTTTGHPNGDINTRYCAKHAFVPTWDESPEPYAVAIFGPVDYPLGAEAVANNA